MSLRVLVVLGGVLALLLLGILGWEESQGRSQREKPIEPVAAKPLDVTLLPDFKTTALQTHKETVERPLFVPTRRPAPPPDIVAPGKVERGLFVLTGTAIVGSTRIAFLRNAKDNKPKTVRIGDVVEGMNVSVITADRVVLTAGGQEEELLLKVATGPKGAITPATLPGMPGAPGAAPPTAPRGAVAAPVIPSPPPSPVARPAPVPAVTPPQPVAPPSQPVAKPATPPGAAPAQPPGPNQQPPRGSGFGPFI